MAAPRLALDFARVKPQVAIISVGSNNDDGCPAPEIPANGQSVSANIYQTDLNGNINVTIDGNAYSVLASL